MPREIRVPAPPRQAIWGDTRSALERKTDICAKILAEARRMVRVGQFGSPHNQLVFRACELLDELDEVLVALHPARNGCEFASAAALHRELEQIQEAIGIQAGGARPGRKPIGNDR